LPPIKPTCPRDLGLVTRSNPMALVAIAAVVVLFGALNFLDFKRFD
jgi:hypothetical protein